MAKQSTKKNGPPQPDDDHRVSKGVKIGRNASTGQFVAVNSAKKKPATHVVETIKRGPPSKKPKK